jgi:dsDNA-specific endonuclease/ATPase MutS2
MSKEAQIKAVLEDYLNLASSLQGYSRAREEAQMRYDHLLAEHHSPDNNYTTHTAAPILSAHDEIEKIDRDIMETRHKLSEAAGKIKQYLLILKGRSLEVHFTYDSLNHRAGTHSFYLEDGELSVQRIPEKV